MIDFSRTVLFEKYRHSIENKYFEIATDRASRITDKRNAKR